MATKRIRRPRRHPLWQCMMIGTLTAGSVQVAHAFDIETGLPDVKLRWDNTVKYSAAARVKGRSDALIANPNFDDGDRNFSRGLISNRFDLLSEADLSYQNFGGRLSGAAWYDRVYRGDSDNDSPATSNTVSTPYPGFPEETRKLHGKKGELLDAFVYGKVDVGEESALSFRAGRHSLLWGESLFFGGNGIGNGMTTVDVIKALSVPNTQFKELLRPIGQVSGLYQIRSNLAVGAYYQYRFEPYRLPSAGSYFAAVDPSPTGGESVLVPGPGGALLSVPRGADIHAKDSGQGGLHLRWRPDNWGTDLGFYAIRYHDRTPQQVTLLVPTPNFYFVYPEGVQAYGVSASKTLGDYNLAFEFSVRKHAPLVSVPTLAFVPGTSTGYARGTTLHANFNWIASLGPSFIAQEASFVGELAANYTQRVTENPQAVSPTTRRSGMGMRFVYEPTYRQVFPGLDVGVPVGLGYTPAGRSSAAGGLGVHHGGDMSIGLNGTYLAVWKFSLNYTHYYGPEATFVDANNNQTFRQTLKDRDFVSLSLQTTF